MIFIEGNIGSGKSTFIKCLQDRGHLVNLEPVDKWTAMKNGNGKNLLEEFYGDQARNAYMFQSIAFRTRIMSITQNPSTFVERSVFTDKNVFAKTCHETGKMNDLEWIDYCEWFKWLTTVFNIKPAGYIYLRADPKISHERIVKRSRGGEENIPFDYLKNLHEKHDNWLLKEDNVLVLDVNDEFENDQNKLNVMLDKVEKYISKK